MAKVGFLKKDPINYVSDEAESDHFLSHFPFVTYLSKEFTHHPVPLSSFLISFTVFVVVNPFETVVEF